MLNKNQQLKAHSYDLHQKENQATPHKIPQLKVQTGILIGTCTWDPRL